MKLSDFRYPLPRNLIAKYPASPRDTVPPDGGEPRGRIDHGNEVLRDRPVLQEGGLPGRERDQGVSGPAVRPEGKDEREDRGLPPPRAEQGGEYLGRDRRPGPESPHRQQDLLRRREALVRGHRQHHVARDEPSASTCREISSRSSTGSGRCRSRTTSSGSRPRRTRRRTRRSLPGSIGAVAAPTAGLHFTKRLLTTLKTQGGQGGSGRPPRRARLVPAGGGGGPDQAQDGLGVLRDPRKHRRGGEQDHRQQGERLRGRHEHLPGASNRASPRTAT